MIKNILLLCILFYSETWANVTISPVVLVLKNGEKITSFDVINTGKEKKTYQLDVYEWDISVSTGIGEVDPGWTISPKIFSVEPGSSQLVRLANKTPLLQKEEKTNRVLLREIQTEEARKNIGVHVSINLNIPLFSEGRTMSEEKPIVTIAEGKLVLKNPNNHHLDLGHIEVEGRTIPLGGYIMGGAERKFDAPNLGNGTAKLYYGLNGKVMNLEFTA